MRIVRRVASLALLAWALAVSAAIAQVPAPPSAFPDVQRVDGAPVLSQPPLAYPREAQSRQIEGRVVVAFLVGTDGAPERHRIIESEPPLLFDATVNAAAPDFRFPAATRDGKPVRYETRLTLSFRPNPREGAK